jgi:hypothetical protein
VPKTGATLKTVPVTGDGAPPKSGKSLSNSPYQNGAPPITGGFTNTSQGAKTSGDPMAVPARGYGEFRPKPGNRPGFIGRSVFSA